MKQMPRGSLNLFETKFISDHPRGQSVTRRKNGIAQSQNLVAECDSTFDITCRQRLFVAYWLTFEALPGRDDGNSHLRWQNAQALGDFPE
jgi:hypothetical protein